MYFKISEEFNKPIEGERRISEVYGVKAKDYLGLGFEEGRRGRPGRYLQHNPKKTNHRCSPESKRKAMKDRTRK